MCKQMKEATQRSVGADIAIVDDLPAVIPIATAEIDVVTMFLSEWTAIMAGQRDNEPNEAAEPALIQSSKIV